MLKKYSQFLIGILVSLDVVFLFISWVLAYWVRFDLRFPNPPNYTVTFSSYLSLLWIVLPVCILIFDNMGLYETKRTLSKFQQIVKVTQVSSLAVVLVAFIIYFIVKKNFYSRIIFILFGLFAVFFLSLSRFIIYTVLRTLRKKGYNLRHVLIVGAGKLGHEVANKINQHPEFGLNIIGFLSDSSKDNNTELGGIKVLGTYHDLNNVIARHPVDQVVFALPARDEGLLRTLLGYMNTETLDVRVVLDIDGFLTLRRRIEDLDGLAVISLRDGPFYGLARLAKRIFDIIVSFVILIITFPIMLIIAFLIKVTSRGPIFYLQERLSLDGKKFRMIKFRTMRIDAEKNIGPAWSRKEDPRRTKLGAVLRRASLDELPQLLNVLKGDMSLVGPRPERPVFVEEFKKRIPNYMLRHKIKTGITGWAQVHGLRGDTSIEKRIEYDIYYIEHWSVWLDLKILFLTFFAIFRKEGAY